MPKETKPNAKEQLFLEKWRALEKTLSEHGFRTVVDLEKELETNARQRDANMLRICRQIRNFIVHNTPGFIGITDDMIVLVSDLEYEAARSDGTVKGIMITPSAYGCVKLSDTVAKAATVLYKKKRSDVIVTDQNGIFIGLLGARGLAAVLSDLDSGWTLEKLAGKNLLTRHNIDQCLPDTPISEMPAYRTLVLDEKGKCLGVANEEELWPYND